MRKWTRRAFIGTGAIAGGGLILGVGGIAFSPSRHSVVSDDALDIGQLTTWVTVTPDNIVTILIPHCEMGQGAQTALAMMAAEELGADWNLVRIQEAPADDRYANAYIIRALAGGSIPSVMVRAFDYGTYRLASWYGTQATGGSTSVRGTGVYGMCVAGAAAREMLVAAAAEQFGVSPTDCTVRDSVISHTASGRSATFGELASAAARRAVPSAPALKDPETYTIRRTARPRFDIPSRVDGSAVYGIDFKVEGMLHAAVQIAPVYGGRLTSVETAAAEAMPGVKQVVRLDEAVAVVADTYWHARKALATIEPVFDDAGHGGVSSDTIFAAYDRSLGASPAMPESAARVVTADYRVPFLAHATMEPMVCTARVDANSAEVWAGTQDPLNARSTAASALGLDVEQVRIHNLPLGGGFGRRLPMYLDYIDLGVRIARAVSPTPVKTIYSRENDIQHDYYRPAGMARFAAALDATGHPIAVHCAYAGGGDGESTYMPYAITTKEAEDRDAPHPISTGPWRSVLNSQHGFFKEAFIDEVAHAAGKDSFEFRRDLLDEQPRFKAVLERAASMAGWGTPLPDGEGRGIALVESFNTIVAQVAHVAVSPAGRLRVRHVYAAVDCGDVVNLDTAAAQVEGSIIFGLSAALLGEITIAEGRVVQRNFSDHRMIRMADAPQVTVEFVRSGADLGGLGEPCVPPVAAAVTNAIFAATGVRIRTLPIGTQNLRPGASSAA